MTTKWDVLATMSHLKGSLTSTTTPYMDQELQVVLIPGIRGQQALQLDAKRAETM